LAFKLGGFGQGMGAIQPHLQKRRGGETAADQDDADGNGIAAVARQAAGKGTLQD